MTADQPATGQGAGGQDQQAINAAVLDATGQCLGPLTLLTYPHYWVARLETEEGFICAEVYTDPELNIDAAKTAQLFSAAEMMFAALEDCIEHIDLLTGPDDPITNTVLDQARAAITAARSGSYEAGEG
jgi:hypothetical protein